MTETPSTPRRSPALRRFALVAVVVPAVLTVAAIAVQLFALPHVPATIAVHWGASGEPDGFGPAWTQPVLTLVVGLGLPLLIALTSLPGLRRGDAGASYRLMGAVAAALSALMAVLATGSLVAQIGLDDPRNAPSVLPVLLAAFAVAVVVGIAAWFVQPTGDGQQSTGTPAPSLTVASGERPVWFATASMSRGAVAAISATCLLLIAVGIGSWYLGVPFAASLTLSVVAVVVTVLALSSTVFHVRVDAEGLTVESVVRLPRFRVPLADVAAVTVVDVNPMGEFGGWGIRLVPGRFGIVLRTGPAIEVQRRSGRRFVVTVHDAARGAALLQALADRDRPAAP